MVPPEPQAPSAPNVQAGVQGWMERCDRLAGIGVVTPITHRKGVHEWNALSPKTNI